MTAQQLASILDGREYCREITKDEQSAARKAGLVVVFGYSDDLVELRGAIEDEVGAYDTTTFYVTPEGLPKSKCECDECPYFEEIKKTGAPVEAVWCAPGAASWTFKTTIPHATFNVMEDGDLFCVGIVFALADVAGVAP